jgi:hypothetical protein
MLLRTRADLGQPIFSRPIFLPRILHNLQNGAGESGWSLIEAILERSEPSLH